MRHSLELPTDALRTDIDAAYADYDADATVVAVCAAERDVQRAAGRLFEAVGRAIASTALAER
ncbi:hypothetical protein LJR039_000118 [Pseudorhodoferax sp. LjRoot39]|uniref:hypothetical protein n=1 Tax=Pseudorhodoferax sp. LjRoot39 TaxID=3342328 RepID=UPI003ECF0696